MDEALQTYAALQDVLQPSLPSLPLSHPGFLSVMTHATAREPCDAWTTVAWMTLGLGKDASADAALVAQHCTTTIAQLQRPETSSAVEEACLRALLLMSSRAGFLSSECCACIVNRARNEPIPLVLAQLACRLLAQSPSLEHGETIVALMRRFDADLDVAREGTRALLMYCTSSIDTVVSAGGAAAVLAVCDAHGADVETATLVCKILKLLTCHVPTLFLGLPALNFFRVLRVAWARHGDNAAFVEVVLSCCDTIGDKYQHKVNLQPFVSLILDALKRYGGYRQIVRLAANTTLTITYNDDHVITSFIEGGAVPCLVTALGVYYRDKQIAAPVLAALQNMSSNKSLGVAALLQADAMRALLSALRHYNASSNAAKYAYEAECVVSVLQHVTYSKPDVMIFHGGVELVLASLKIHAKSSLAIAEVGCYILAMLSSREDHCALIAAAGGCDAVSDVLKHHGLSAAVPRVISFLTNMEKFRKSLLPGNTQPAHK